MCAATSSTGCGSRARRPRVELVLYFLFFFPGVTGAGLRRLEICRALLALSRSQLQQPGRHPDLPVQVGHRRGRHPALPARHRAGVPLHHLPAHRRMAARRRRRRGDREGADGSQDARRAEARFGSGRHPVRLRTRRRHATTETANDRSSSRRRHAADPDPGDLPRLSRRLHADGAGRRPSATTPISTPTACGAPTSARSKPAPTAGR